MSFRGDSKGPRWAAWTAAALLVLSSLPAFAGGSAPATLTAPSAWPSGQNVPVTATLSPASGWAEVRVYFQAAGSNESYFLDMHPAQALDGSFWAALPIPTDSTSAVTMYVSASGPDGQTVTSLPVTVPVSASAAAIALTPEQWRYASSLVVGETSADEQGKPVDGFSCQGIASRVDTSGQVRADDECRKETLAALGLAGGDPADPPAASAGSNRWLVPLAVLGAAGGAAAVVHNNDSTKCPTCDCSTSHP